MNVLANDGISQEGVEKLNAAGFNTMIESVDQSNIIEFINENNNLYNYMLNLLYLYSIPKKH